MKTTLEHLLEAGNDLINQIDEARAEIEDKLSDIGGAANSVEESVKDLSAHAQYLIHCIREAHKQTPHAADPVETATVAAIGNLLTLLTEAKTYFVSGNSAAGFGTLGMFDEHAQDLRAALRLRRAQRRGS